MTVRRVSYVISALLVVSGLVHLGVLLVTHGSWHGPVSWRKPMTFGLSFGLTLATITWLSSYVRLRAWLLGGFAAACVLEVALITVQAWRRTPSHFNLSTPLDGVIARTLAAGGAVHRLQLRPGRVRALLVAAEHPGHADRDHRGAAEHGDVEDDQAGPDRQPHAGRRSRLPAKRHHGQHRDHPD